MSFWHALGEQLKHPKGMTGRAVGRAMRLVNTVPNKAAVEALNLQPNDRILELGFGPGQAVHMMAQHVSHANIHGIDISREMLAQACKLNRCAVNDGRVSLILGEFYSLPYADHSFDKILAVNVIYFWDDAPAVLRECRRVLKPGGTMALYATDESAMRKWKFAGAETHLLFSCQDIRSAFLQGGFKAEDIAVKTLKILPGVTGLLATAVT
ncbi:MAG: class I SAM-dependent methyltransferase [Alphaproteobacteria bacterium]|nr:class I SAM-dependent methyltransferase [Alphaproteobacteria bacterium]